MDVEILARFQFALTIMFHYIYPPLSIGIGLILVIMEGIYIKTKDPIYLEMAKFWTKVFALTFAMGVATGIVMEFEFGTNWANYSRFVGDVFGSALAAEGVFAFFLESGFLALLLFGWNRVSPRMHYFATWMVCLGAHFSAIWIVVANSWMQTPAGFVIEGEGIKARAVITDFWAMVFNPSSMTRLFHTIIGCWLAGAFLVISLAAYYILKKRHHEFAKNSLKIGLSVALVACILQLITGDTSARIIAKYQPAKLAAIEGLYKTQKGAPLSIWGIPNSETQTLDYGFKIPYLLSFLTFRDFNAEVKGLDTVPRKDWPRVSVVFQTYHLMIATWACMMMTTLLAIYLWRKGTLFQKKWMLRLLVASSFFPQIGNQAGWVTAEMGRYPWIVQGLLRISEGLSKSVVAEQVLGSIILFGIVYTLLFILFVYMLNEKFKHGPMDLAVGDVSTPYHQQYVLVQDVFTQDKEKE
ncbi:MULTISPECIES: cytochrome ubiquinol oxidase subunit I [unclassified Neochlamydia]|uniref:cytochrome ubiquinol oxidase subunit I n=1 Tax=unclassified Neochlamydia TaxID=2643326 RepID=UPI00140E2D91|nr:MULTISPECIES: cytochrome ubiquinol oxidase subunit I [unclassified Neochlamydia]MBS4166806.1 Cytochrome bd ubiquinol oxidase subunit 1 [Neochlamydia sp. AcF65]MBS4170421.1 Cytochrome bd ubiquinol oxidase subunit 1 [Neochlamydia sp. AcF95]NGY95366.1 Cytochrome bd ubiquinol oxidase subunit 1 [Neochlamydia sp. AcF84]